MPRVPHEEIQRIDFARLCIRSADGGACCGHACHLGFFVNSCTEIIGVGVGCDAKQQHPALLAVLTLPGPDSSGSARWDGDPRIPPVYTGDSFTFDFSARYQPLSPSFPGDMECNGGATICNFDLSWAETAGRLDAVSLYMNGFTDTIDIGLSGGVIGTDDTFFGADNTFRGCITAACQVTGYWVNASLLTASEPGGLALLASAFGVRGLVRRRRELHAVLCVRASMQRLPIKLQ